MFIDEKDNNREGFKIGKLGSGNTGGMGDSGAAMGGVAGGAAALMSDSGSNNVERCPINDTSFYCVISRTASIIGMIVYIILIIIFLFAFMYYLYTMYIQYYGSKSSKSNKK